MRKTTYKKEKFLNMLGHYAASGGTDNADLVLWMDMNSAVQEGPPLTVQPSINKLNPSPIFSCTDTSRITVAFQTVQGGRKLLRFDPSTQGLSGSVGKFVTASFTILASYLFSKSEIRNLNTALVKNEMPVQSTGNYSRAQTSPQVFLSNGNELSLPIPTGSTLDDALLNSWSVLWCVNDPTITSQRVTGYDSTILSTASATSSIPQRLNPLSIAQHYAGCVATRASL